jgi:hypothetical protein
MLAAEERNEGRRRLLLFGTFNALSFTLLTGNMISLYLLRLGASNSLIGVVASFSYVSFFFLFLGRTLVVRVGVIRTFAWAWLLRYIAFIPVLVAPVFLLHGSSRGVYALVTVGVFGFHLFRGIGMVANAPMFSGFADDTDRGRLLSQFQMIVSVVTILVGIAVAILLGAEAAVGRYVLFLGLGVAFGIVATGVLFSLPELEDFRYGATQRFVPLIRGLFERLEVRRFFLSFLLVAIASGVGRSFLIVYAKQAHGYTDRLAFFMVAVGSLGNFLAGYLGSILLDRLGARPLLLFSLSAYFVSIVVAVFIPPVGGIGTMVGIGIVFFLGTLGYSGNENASQAYFFGVSDRGDQLNLGIVFFLTLGIGGAIGSFLGGFFLDGLATIMEIVWAFRVLWIVTAGAVGGAFLVAGRLAPLGAETFRGTLEVIFSPRDLRTVGLLNRLGRTRDPKDEQEALRTLGQTGSEFAVGEVIERLQSPSYAIRQEALEALGALPYTEAVEAALIRHLDEAVHTTAFQAVRILGLRGTAAAIPVVRGVIDSEDVLLGDRAVVAYARLAGAGVLDELIERLGSAENPRRLMHFAVAFQVVGERRALNPLVAQLGRSDIPPYVIDEIVLAGTHILGIHEYVYPRYSAYIRSGEGYDALRDDLIVAIEQRCPGIGLSRVVNALLVDRDADAAHGALEAAIPAIPGSVQEIVTTIAATPKTGRRVFFGLSIAIYAE